MSSHPLLLAAAPTAGLSESSGILETLEFQVVGLVIVLGALATLYLLCAALGWFFRHANRPAATTQAAAQPAGDGVAAPTEVATEPGDAPAPVVVIAAAVAAVVAHPHRLLRVSPAPLGWSLEGRRQLLTSHQLRH